jgi:hypothetical protein
MKKQILNNATFTSREMQAITTMLLSSEGINVDPIIDDLYPNLDDSQKSLFRCKMALLLKGNLPEFQVRSGFRRVAGAVAYAYNVIGESSLMGTLQLVKVARYNKRTDENGNESWEEELIPENEQSVENQNFDYQLFDTLEEAIKKW